MIRMFKNWIKKIHRVLLVLIHFKTMDNEMKWIKDNEDIIKDAIYNDDKEGLDRIVQDWLNFMLLDLEAFNYVKIFTHGGFKQHIKDQYKLFDQYKQYL